MSQLTPRLQASLWWLLPLVVLAAILGWETDWGRAVVTPPLAVERVEPKPIATSLLPEFAIAGGVAARSETVARTLFNPTRRPAPVLAVEGTAGRMQRGQFALTGTTLVDGKNTAFLREVAGNKSRRVQAGEKINGLLVAEVRSDRVRFTLGDESEELVLRVATNPRPTPPPVAAAPPGQPTPAGVVPAPPPVAAQGAQDAAQALAERRRAAARNAPQPTPPMTPATPAAPTAAPAAAPDPRWETDRSTLPGTRSCRGRPRRRHVPMTSAKHPFPVCSGTPWNRQ